METTLTPSSSVEKILQDFFEKSLLLESSFSEQVHQSSDNPLWFSLKTNNPKYFLGRDGENLHAITYILKRIIEKNFNEETAKAFTLDVNDFYKKKIDSLKTTAHMLAERAKYFKSNIDVDPMNPYDRRIVHEYLQNYPDIQTESVGEGRNRHIVIKYISKDI